MIDSPSHRSRSLWRILAVAFVLASGLAIDASGQEVFSWWRRGLIEFDLEPGGWVLFESTEVAEGRAVVEIFRVSSLLEEDDGSHWLMIRYADEEDSWVLRVDPRLSREEDQILDALLELYHVEPGGEAAAEDLDAIRENRLVRRHFNDLFASPEIARVAMPDSTVDGRVLKREHIVLSETQEQTVDLGRRKLVYAHHTRSQAVVSPEIPIFGLIASSTVSTIYQKAPVGDNSVPPLITELSLSCLDFGREGDDPGLPGSVVEVRRLLENGQR